MKSTRDAAGEFELRAPAVVVTSGGIGHNHELMRRNWPTDRVGAAPEHMISGVPAHVDGRMQGIAEGAGATMVNKDRMWAYVEGIHNWDPVWPDHAIRILPGPSSMWFDATGRPARGHVGRPRRRLDRRDEADPRDRPRLLVVRAHPVDHREGVRALRLRAEPRHHRQGPEVPRPEPARARARPARSRRSRSTASTSSWPTPSPSWSTGMNELARGPELDARRPRAADRRARPRGRQRLLQGRPGDGDPQRPPQPHRQADPRRQAAQDPRPGARPADRRTPQHPVPQDARRARDQPRRPVHGAPTARRVPGLYAAGEVAGFGGGGVHGYNALEGTFLGGCIFSGRAVGRALAR